MADRLETYDEDSWDMSARRERAVMAEGSDLFEASEPKAAFTTSRGRLSAAEIEALLRPDLSDMGPEPGKTADAPQSITPREITTFETDNKQAKTAQPQDMREARRLAARLSLALRRDCGLKAAATPTLSCKTSFSEALGTPGKGSAIACYAGPDGEIAAMLVLSPPLTDTLIDTACGGQAAPGGRPTKRALTPMDAALLEGLVRPLGSAIAGGLTFARVETDPDFAAALAPPVEALVIALDVRVGGQVLPAVLILSDDDLFETAQAVEAPASLLADIQRPGQIQPISGAAAVTAVLTARIASLSVPLSQLSDLKAGSTLLLGVPADQPVELLSGGREGVTAAEGRIGRKGGKMAVRITRKGPALR